MLLSISKSGVCVCVIVQISFPIYQKLWYCSFDKLRSLWFVRLWIVFKYVCRHACIVVSVLQLFLFEHCLCFHGQFSRLLIILIIIENFICIKNLFNSTLPKINSFRRNNCIVEPRQMIKLEVLSFAWLLLFYKISCSIYCENSVPITSWELILW